MRNFAERPISPFVNGTDEREACTECWYAALVQTNCERSTATKLEGLSYEVYVAVQEEMHRWSDRMKKIQRLVIPNIIFVKTRPERLEELRRYTFIRGILANPGEKQPAAIPERQITSLQFMLGQTDSPVYMENNVRSLKLGDQIRVIRGSLKGMEGTIYRVREGDLHIGVHIKNLGFAHVNINANDLENF